MNHQQFGPAKLPTSPVPSVALLFTEEPVKAIFSELLSACGAQTSVVDDPSDLSAYAHVVTEPRFLGHLSDEQRKQCLIVGNKSQVTDRSINTLERPLTEITVESALSRFMRGLQQAA